MLKGVSRRSPELVDDGRQNGMFRCRAVQPTDRHVPKKDNASNLGVSQTTRVVLYLSVGPAGKDQKGAVDTIPVTATGSSDKTRDKETSTDLNHSHRCATDRYNYPVTFYSLYASTTAALQRCCLTTTEQFPTRHSLAECIRYREPFDPRHRSHWLQQRIRPFTRSLWRPYNKPCITRHSVQYSIAVYTCILHKPAVSHQSVLPLYSLRISSTAKVSTTIKWSPKRFYIQKHRH
ncbi:hypothetical protein NP493_3914g00016 [Ridgeia piscesae]|uniref:Uncharacterized protein n=1 Tax=Ridgeia piscesae TaxID=27915 RepID=A0AAD9J4K3_RIDPI|nr:hypothetical protein NP493_3914g00016 [Ridgeia piscesae]